MAFYDEGATESSFIPRPLGPRRPRPVTDYGSSLVQWMRVRQPKYKGGHRLEWERPSASYTVDMLPPFAAIHSPADTIPVRHLHQSIGKSKKPITVVRWTPEGRRLLTGGHTGEFMLWNGTAFNFETVMDAHYDQYQAGVTSAEWSHSHEWLISGGQKGDVKYWRPNFNNVETVDDAHHDAVRDLAWCPNDTRFLSASDDTTLKIFDFNARACELVLAGHGWDVKSCDWHPTKGLLVSGSKDHQSQKYSDNYEIFSNICILRGHEKAHFLPRTWTLSTGPVVSTGKRGRIFISLPMGGAQFASRTVSHPLHPYDTTDPSNTPAQVIFPAHRIQFAHSSTIWSLDWHPLGHILASGSKDNFTRFWSRTRPGETTYLKDRFHIGEEAAEAQGTWNRGFGRRQMREEEEQEIQDEAEGLVDQKRPESLLPGIQGMPPPDGPGLPGLIPGIGAVHPPPPPLPVDIPSSMPHIDPGRLAALLSSGAIPHPPPPQHLLPQNPGQMPFPIPVPEPNVSATACASTTKIAPSFWSRIDRPKCETA
ncbi:polyadenylation factor subunit 2 [Coccidioides immitis RMSCC 3703]|uniref:Polyadenylation factor subunit 2 n=1 Tax=Coccidioides immitis RMSCC 3703 TaxID=454286 RepID=A0A0J8QS81_COCIT|nr:polyadenylation factor subunit 2 [Coccidioides immitis RMSCC 3703]